MLRACRFVGAHLDHGASCDAYPGNQPFGAKACRKPAASDETQDCISKRQAGPRLLSSWSCRALAWVPLPRTAATEEALTGHGWKLALGSERRTCLFNQKPDENDDDASCAGRQSGRWWHICNTHAVPDDILFASTGHAQAIQERLQHASCPNKAVINPFISSLLWESLLHVSLLDFLMARAVLLRGEPLWHMYLYKSKL